jgi:hypothetical protein
MGPPENDRAPGWQPRAAADLKSTGTSVDSPTRPVRPHRCAGCGTIGRISTAIVDPADERPVLRLSWCGAGRGVRLLCACCSDGAP